ncbi:hypothetical protein RUND412_004528 [Rhizina undulata]
MHNQLPSGAYLISTWDGKCIQIKNGRQSIEKHDPHGHRQQQIFWIEALPEHGDDQEDGAVYSISDLTGDLFLDSAADWPSFSEKFNFKNIIAARRNGRPWQKWRIKRVEDDEHGESYNIFSLYDSAILSLKSVVVVDVHKKEVENYTQAIIKKFEAKIRAQPWEFVIPLVGVPPGWVQIRNILTGRILQQMYITSLPFLAAETTASPSLNTIMNWRLQWVFLLPENDGTSLQNSWAIRNRLTRGFLSYDNASNAGGKGMFMRRKPI